MSDGDSGAWEARASCRDADPELWFPPVESGRAGYAYARSICTECPVRRECLTDAMLREGPVGHAARFGMYGGLTPKERAQIGPKREHPGDANLVSQQARRAYPLSPTRHTVAELALSGMRGRAIAAEMNLAPCTVFHHLGKLRDLGLIPESAGRERPSRGDGAA